MSYNETMKSFRAFLITAIAVSALIHLLGIIGVVYLAPLFETKPPETIEITLDQQNLPKTTKSKEAEKQIVRQALVPDQIKAPDDETLAKYLSEKKQRVKQEMQAAHNGMTENRSNTSTLPQKQKPIPQAQQKSKATGTEKDKDGFRDLSKELAEMNQLSQGQSAVGEALPTTVKVGSFTALNTDRYLFYTFYARIEELIRYRWESRVQRATYSKPMQRWAWQDSIFSQNSSATHYIIYIINILYIAFIRFIYSIHWNQV
jgi:hypothetical protein